MKKMILALMLAVVMFGSTGPVFSEKSQGGRESEKHEESDDDDDDDEDEDEDGEDGDDRRKAGKAPSGGKPAQTDFFNDSQGKMTAPASVTMSYTAAEVAKHATAQDAWIIVSGQVYDISGFINSHSGGDVFRLGKDNSTIFQQQHGNKLSILSRFLIGKLVP